MIHNELSVAGRQVDLTLIKPADVPNATQIGRILGNMCRFTGNVSRFYSVAEHSVHVAALVQEWGFDTAAVRCALLHDAHEIFVGDVSTPLKRNLGTAFRLIDGSARHSVCQAFDLTENSEAWETVHAADYALLAHEAIALGVCDQDNPPKAWRHVMDRAHKLTGSEIPSLQCWTPHTAGQRFQQAAREMGLKV